MIPMGQWLTSLPKPEAAAALADFGQAEPAVPQADVEAAVQEAYERGRGESDAINQQLMQGLLEQERAVQSEALAEARAAWCREQSEAIAVKLTAAFEQLDRQLSQALTVLLTPFLAEQARQRAVAQFAEALRSLADNGGGLIRLEAPEDLLAALRAAPGGLPDGIDCVAADHGEVLAACESTVIETRLKPWLDALRESAA